MLLVGLTGGIASGKSQVCSVFKELGARVIDADAVARELVEPATEAWTRIKKEFGPELFLPDGTLNRTKMAEVIFSDPALRFRLEAILHPLIGDEIADRIKRYAEEDPDAIIIVDAALMIEIGKHEDFDKLIVVYSDENTQIERLMSRDKISRRDAYRRVKAQMTLESKLDLADYVIDNSASPEDTRRQAIKVFNYLRNLAGKPAGPRNADQE